MSTEPLNCSECGPVTPRIGREGKHLAARCPNCDKWIKWLPQNNDNRRPAAHQDLVRKYGEGYCQMCLRHQSELRDKDTLEAHHVVEFSSQAEPDSSIENIWIVCTPCHRLIHWMRTYHGRNELVDSVAATMGVANA